MKTTTIKLAAIFFATINLALGQAADDKKEDKKKVKVQVLVGDKIIAPNQVLGKSEVELGVKVFPFDAKDRKEKRELVVTDFDIALIHHGRKIAEENISGKGSIANLAALAKNDDTYAIEIKEIYEKLKDGTLRTYAKGICRLNYMFFDTKLAISEYQSKRKAVASAKN